mgnify:CR=1 FL=1
MQAILNIAINAARKSGGLLLRERMRLDKQSAPRALPGLLARVETTMREIIAKAHPQHGIATVDSQMPEADTIWHLEVIDGFENLLRNIPHYAIVILIEQQQKPCYALIYDPHTEEIFTAAAGGGAQCNDYRLRVNQCKGLQDAVLATSMLQAGQLRDAGLIADLNTQGATLYNQGCSALALAYVAAGRIDGFYGAIASKTVLKAAALLLSEAGSLVSDGQGAHDYLASSELIAANPKLLKACLLLLRKYYSN